MGKNRIVMWPRRHSIERVHRPGDWLGLGKNNAVVTPAADVEPVVEEAPASSSSSSGEPEAPAEASSSSGAPVALFSSRRGAMPSGLAVELAAAAAASREVARGRGRPPKVKAKARARR